jgi:hypothetical protein
MIKGKKRVFFGYRIRVEGRFQRPDFSVEKGMT